MSEKTNTSLAAVAKRVVAGIVVVALSQNIIAANDEWTLHTTEIKPVLFSDDHTAEGVLAPLADGRIMLIFRLDPGVEGDHTGTNGRIVRMTYDPEADQWGQVKTVYNSHQYDDRNIHGGVTKDGRIVVFFRHYTEDGRTEGRYFIYSDDSGRTWTEPQVSQSWSDPQNSGISGIWSTGQMFFNPDIDRYMMLGCRRYFTHSADGASWDEHSIMTKNQEHALTEIAGAWCGNNRILALIRDDQRERGHPLLQIESRDNGKTWTDPAPTNIPPDRHWGAAPQLIYDRNRELLIALNSTRYSLPNDQQGLFIYTADPDDVMGKPQNWDLRRELRRPWAVDGFKPDRQLNMNFYGYPTIAAISEDEYLVVFTERARIDGHEQADLYYFRLIFE